MKRYLLGFIFSACAFFAFSQGGVIIIEGNYQGKNLYVQNPFASGGVGFCVTEVYVNGNLTTDETQSSAFEIDFKPHKLTIGDKVEIKIKHKEDCRPKVLNPEVLKPKSTYEVTAMSVSADGTLNGALKEKAENYLLLLSNSVGTNG